MKHVFRACEQNPDLNGSSTQNARNIYRLKLRYQTSDYTKANLSSYKRMLIRVCTAQNVHKTSQSIGRFNIR